MLTTPNIKSFLQSQLTQTYNEKIGFPVDKKLLKVTYFGNHGIDYTVRTLQSLCVALKPHQIYTPEELYNILSSDMKNNEFLSISFSHQCLNINLSLSYVEKRAYHLFKNGLSPPFDQQGKKKILVDFSSPNIAKDMHVGHLRSTIIGDSICNLYSQQGHTVYRVNHIGDYGLQFGMIIQNLLEQYPDYRNSDLTISDLQSLYAASKKRFDQDEDFKKKAYQNVVLLQSPQGGDEIHRAWQFLKDVSKLSYDDIYCRLGIRGLEECPESFYQDFIRSSLLDDLAPLLKHEDGRQVIYLEGHKVPLTVVKSDGGFTYDTTDLAALKYRLQTLKMDKIIYVVDNGQAEHFTMVFKVAELLGWKTTQEVIHVGFGVVLGPDGKKFKSRAGDTMKLSTLLDEALSEASKVLENKDTGFSVEEKEQIVKNVAYSSVKYADLSALRTNDYKFSFSKMLSLKGNTGAYQLYEHVRICSILKKASLWISDIDTLDNFVLEEKEEISLCKTLFLFPEIIEVITEDLSFHTLCTYLYNLTNAFSLFHTKCRCLNFTDGEITSVNQSRLTLCILTKRVIEQCFEILGLMWLEKM